MVAGLPSVDAAVVLFRSKFSDVRRLVVALTAAASVAIEAERVGTVSVALGDCSPVPLDDKDRRTLEKLAAESCLSGVTYDYFGANLGSSGGRNRLVEGCSADFILILDPDTYPAPTLLRMLLASLSDPSVGGADARQVPLEHPKEFDRVTGDTSWLDGSCMLVRRDLFRSLSGFDSEHFFLYCDDVDFSWRLRLRGFRAVHQPRAVFFHDRLLGKNGHVAYTPVERFYRTLGRLMLAYKYDRSDVVAETIAAVETAGDADQRAAVEEWRRREASNLVPSVTPDAESVAQFVGDGYARHRF